MVTAVWRGFVAVVLVGILSFVYGVDSVLACTLGPPPTFEQRITSANIIVRGQIVESDTVHQAHIIQVFEYIVGGPGPEFLLIQQTAPYFSQALIDTNAGGGDCVWFESPDAQLQEHYFWFGEPLETGHYSVSNYVGFSLPMTGFPHILYDESGAEVGTLEDRDAFEAWVLEIHEDEPVLPLTDSRYPSIAPLLAVDSEGNHYILPVNTNELTVLERHPNLLYEPWTWYFQEPVCEETECIYTLPDYERVECINYECIHISANGRTHIVDRGDNTFRYTQNYTSFEFTADEYLLSEHSLATWEDSTIRIYALHDTLRYFGEGEGDIPRQVNEITISDDGVSSAGVWSDDGQLFAYTDDDGIWLWTPFVADSSPMLLISATDNAGELEILHFAGSQRYLAYQNGDTRHLLDLITRTEQPFSYPSPDGRLALMCADNVPTAPENACPLALRQLVAQSNFRLYMTMIEPDFTLQWINNTRAIVFGCSVEANDCGVFDFNPEDQDWDSIFINTFNYYPNIDFTPAIDYALQGQELAILNDGQTITVNGDILRVESAAPLVEIRWLPQVFYADENRFPLYPPIDTRPVSEQSEEVGR